MLAGGAALILSRSSSGPGPGTGSYRRVAGPVSCPIQQPDRASNGEAISEDLAHDLIVCLWQRPAGIASSATFVEAEDLRVGRRRQWVPSEDMGSGNVDTWVYPVRATFTIRNEDRYETMVTTDQGVFNCYVDAFERWECGLGQNLTRNSPRHIRK